jgi:hypothetical protein
VEERERGAGTILRPIDFVNQSPWYIITWLYDGASAALAAWYLRQLMTFLLHILVVCVGHIMRAPRPSSVFCRPREQARPPIWTTFVPALKSCYLPASCWSVSNIIISLRASFFSTPLSPPPPPSPTFSPCGKGMWVAGWKGFFIFYLPKKNSVLATCLNNVWKHVEFYFF